MTHERERQENVFQELQHAIDYLDHAPAGFFSVDPRGAIVYMNATLAGWLDYDLAKVGSGGLALRRHRPGQRRRHADRRSSASPATCAPRPSISTCAGATASSCRCACSTGSPSAQDGRPAPSRTLVLNRSPGEDVAEGQRAAEVRFARFFNTTPIAIATIDRSAASCAPTPPSCACSACCRARARAGRAARSSTPSPSATGAPWRPPSTAAAEGASDIAPLDIGARRRGGRSARVWLSPVSESEEENETRDPLRARHHRAAPARAAVRPGAEDERRRPARRRRRARLQQRAAGDHRLLGPPARQPPADRPGVPGHHADQAEREPGREPGAPAARLLAPADAASGDPQPRRHALRPLDAAAPPARRDGSSSTSSHGARPLAREGRRQPVRAGHRQPRRQRARRHAAAAAACRSAPRNVPAAEAAPAQRPGHAAGPITW